MDIIFNIDNNIILFINKIFDNNTLVINFFSFITHLADGGAIWVIVSIALILKKYTRKNGIFMLSSLLISSIIGNGIIKNIFKRQRPFIQLGIDPFILPPEGFSFPSGHSLVSFVGATCIFLISKRWGIVTYILAFFIALSRVMLMVHYPSDVITGAILGILMPLFIIYILKKLNVDYNK